MSKKKILKTDATHKKKLLKINKINKIARKLKKRKNRNIMKISKVIRILKAKHNLVFKNKFDINLKANNIFFTFSILKKNKIVASGSSGIYKIKTTKKRMKNTYKRLLNIFMTKVYKESTELKKKVNNFNMYNSLIMSISAKKRLHVRIIRRLKKFGKRIIKKRFKLVVLIIKAKKCFNGCRVSKKRRKKRVKFRIFG